ncbi:MAG: hypothetical protein ABI806_08190 [Candidatus Solibacter sp.]
MSNVHLQTSREGVPLDADDRHRMTRLYEEVLIRLEEMAMITARVLGEPPGFNGEVVFNPIALAETDEFRAVEVLRGSQGSGCYDYSQGSCFEYQPNRADSE